MELDLVATDGPTTVRGHRVGRIVGSRDGHWLVDFPGNPGGPRPARTTVHLDGDAFGRVATDGADALLVFEDERSDLPIVVGLLAPLPPHVDVSTSAPTSGDAVRAEAVVDGERVVYTARQEILLRCGKASIQLLSDGTVRVRGTNVLTRASATNRIRGGNVQIN
jgi:hypothetical protein